ncbi:LacI family DNA-binding transcriptional regulator [Deinococcus cellulosilyticus]|uniref:Transcriptional regulator n=1 Tax=Deinococcus cellulosilyticus (strain DSM 18568 / NBRC 106333 / KACC 11606 / 5516J-15) TaxID=1223518 RepID=A0A511MVA8_DEIC1|nr:LacI family DNA-binding transcriptional regulator [Deinococcus cellulosilyticus]GEM44513.1 transcriptional regulator [Deinococcus cellulosilyticus NBRC 106333 = KACC 11606]
MRQHHNLTIQDVAREAGVSTATVSRILNGTGKVSPEKVQRVREVIERLGYKANPFSRSLLTEDLKTVGVLVPNLKDEFYGVIVNTIEQHLLEHDLHMMCSLGHDDPRKEKQAIQTFKSRHLDAYILFTDLLPDEDLLELMQEGVPMVILNRLIPEAASTCLYVDNEMGGEQATRHLLDLGHTRIAHITGPLNRPDTLGRYTGYIRALQAAGVPADPALFASANGQDWAEAEGEKLTQRLLARTHFTALFASNDWLALGAVRALQAAGLRVPQDVSVVSFDDRTFARTVLQGLTAVHFPSEELGTQAAQLVVSLLGEEEPTARPPLQTHLVVRGSTGKVK